MGVQLIWCISWTKGVLLAWLLLRLCYNIEMKIILISLILFLTACSTTGKPIKEHRLIVSAVKQVISPGFGWGK